MYINIPNLKENLSETKVKYSIQSIQQESEGEHKLENQIKLNNPKWMKNDANKNIKTFMQKLHSSPLISVYTFILFQLDSAFQR